MNGYQDLVQALDQLEALQSESRALPSARGHEILDMRRRIAEQTAFIALLGEAAFAETGELDAFRREHSKLRTAIAHHMASWPVIGIDRDNPAYISSLMSIREAYRGFATWIRTATATPSHSSHPDRVSAGRTGT